MVGRRAAFNVLSSLSAHSSAHTPQRTLLSPHQPKLWLGLAALFTAALAAFAPPLLTIAAIVGLLVVLLILRNPLWGAYALVLSVPVQKVVSYQAGPIEITVTQTLFVFVLGVWWAWMSLRLDRRLQITPVAIALLIFLTATLPSLWVTASLPESLAEISRWLVTILSYVIILNSVQSRRAMNWLIAAMLAAGLSEALLGLVQSYGGLGPASFNVGGLLTRAYGTIGAPNSFAGYINLSLPLALTLALYQWGMWFSARKAAAWADRPDFWTLRRLRVPVLMTLMALILFWTLLTSLSRGAWVGLTVGVVAMVLALGKRAAVAITSLIVAALGLVGLGLIGALPPTVTDRFAQLTSQLAIFDPRGIVPTPDNYAVVERMVHWQVAGNMFLSSPWIGVGIGNFNVLFNKFGVQGWPYSRGHAHNYYLNILAETGVVGATFYMLMLLTMVVVGVRAIRRVRASGDSYGEAVAIGAFGILITFMAHNFFENLHALNFGIQWVAALSLFTLVGRRDAYEL
ncbi:MAG: O-antigen ligase family protein [Chloroflexi bacterium]|nr:O-antigen ligase family protein [Chloroflexota bacterium]